MRSLRVNSAVLHHCRPDWSWSCAAGHLRDLDLWVVVRGTGTLRCNDQDYGIAAGDTFLFRQSSDVEGRHDPDNPLSVYATHFDRLNGSGKPLPMDDAELPPVHRRLTSMDLIEPLFARLADSFHDPKRRNTASVWLEAIMLEIFEVDHHPQDAAKPHDAMIDSICRAIRAEPEARRPVAAMASEVGVTPQHFMRLFKARKGMTPSQFVVHTRIDAAKSLLRESNHTITRIAELLGYTDIYFFSRQFKKVSGMTPSAYRR